MTDMSQIFRAVAKRHGPKRLAEKSHRSGTHRRLLEHIRSRLIFVREFLRSPIEVAAIGPSAERLPALLLDRIDWAPRHRAVELGPGTGQFTKALLKKMEPAAVLIAIESNRAFCDHLRRRFDDPRLIVIHASAANLDAELDAINVGTVDCIVSGLPFSSLSAHEAREILDQCRSRMAPGGVFAAYQLRPALRHMLSRCFRTVQSEKVRPRLVPFELTWATAEPLSQIMNIG